MGGEEEGHQTKLLPHLQVFHSGFPMDNCQPTIETLSSALEPDETRRTIAIRKY